MHYRNDDLVYIRCHVKPTLSLSILSFVSVILPAQVRRIRESVFFCHELGCKVAIIGLPGLHLALPKILVLIS